MFLIGAGSGLVPLMAMIRQRRIGAQNVPTALLLSARTACDVLYAKELQAIEFDDPSFVLSWRSRVKHRRVKPTSRDGSMAQWCKRSSLGFPARLRTSSSAVRMAS